VSIKKDILDRNRI